MKLISAGGICWILAGLLAVTGIENSGIFNNLWTIMCLLILEGFNLIGFGLYLDWEMTQRKK